MKKILTTIFVLCTALSMQAALHLSYEKWEGDEQIITEVTENTTITITEYEWDEDMGEALMEVKGQLYSDESENITVTITRQNTGMRVYYWYFSNATQLVYPLHSNGGR